LTLVHILIHIIGPVFLIMGCGYALEKRFNLDIRTLSKLNFYIFVPSLVFVKLSQTSLPLGHMKWVALFTLCMVGTLFIVSLLLSRLRRHTRSMSRAFSLSLMFYNSGNFGLPVIDLAFPMGGAAIQAVVLATQNMLMFSVGLFLATNGRYPAQRALLNILRYPPVYAVTLALIVHEVGWSVWSPVSVVLNYFAQGLVPVALVTLGMQLAKVSLKQNIPDVGLASFCRLALSPCLAFGLIKLMGLSGMLAQALLVSTSVPTAVNTVLLAIELDNEPEYAASAVFLSTLLSALSVSVVIYLARMI